MKTNDSLASSAKWPLKDFDEIAGSQDGLLVSVCFCPLDARQPTTTSEALATLRPHVGQFVGGLAKKL